MINNLINGNLEDAKEQAKRFSYDKINNYLLEHGYSSVKASLAASYLKGADCWQQYCDAA